MLVFVIPLKSKQVSKSWNQTCKLLERTLKSVCNQTSPNFNVIVACHERPTLEFNNSKISYVEVNFLPPTIDTTKATREDFESMKLDQGQKIWAALRYAQSLNPSHIMFVDADDCVSKHIAEFVNQRSSCNGWFINKGYEYRDNSSSIFPKNKDFHQKSSTSHIVKYDLLPHKSIKFEDINWDYLRHQTIVNLMKQQGTPLEPLPFEGAVYITENHENMNTHHAQIMLDLKKNKGQEKFLRLIRKLGKSLVSRPLTDSIRSEFGIYNL